MTIPVSPGDATRDSARGFLYALAGTAVVSTNFVTAKYGLRGFNPETFSFVWTTAAAVFSLAIVVMSGQRLQLRVSRGAGKSMVMLGLTTGVGMILSWAGLARLDPALAAFLWRFHPALAIALGFLVLGERLTRTEALAVAVMIAGGAVSTAGRWNVVGAGTILTLLACLSAAVQMLIAKSRAREVPPNVLVFYRVGVGAVVIAFWLFLTGKADFEVAPRYWYVTFLGALLGPCASFLLTFRSYRYWELSKASMVRTTQPLFVLPLAYIVFGTMPGLKETLGGCLIFAGALWLGWGRMREYQRRPVPGEASAEAVAAPRA
jgi:drug/metabolite transporter (DMT)-like permease